MRTKFEFKPGDAVRFLRPVKGRYSGYAGRADYVAPIGTIGEVRSGPHPAVTGKERDFYNVAVRDWPEGVAVWVGDVAKE